MATDHYTGCHGSSVFSLVSKAIGPAPRADPGSLEGGGGGSGSRKGRSVGIFSN